MDLTRKIGQELDIAPEKVAAAIDLLDSDNTIPFIARYRKEATGMLDEEQLRLIAEWLEKLRALEERRGTILRAIEEQGQLTPELRRQLLSAGSRTELEDLYQPFKPRRKTRASLARERGLQGLADLVIQQVHKAGAMAELVQPYLAEGLPTVDDALAGARDIVAEVISDHPDVRGQTRQKALKWGVLHCERLANADDSREIYRLYYEFTARLDRLQPHQVLAINRGEHDKVLRVSVAVPERDWRAAIAAHFRPDRRSIFAGELELAIQDAAGRLLLPAIERDVRRALNVMAEAHAINVFAANLRALLSQPPLSGHTVMGIDPGYRTGCKVAIVDATGRVLETATIYPHAPQNQADQALRVLLAMVEKHAVTLVSIGNGTASRETEQLVAALTRDREDLSYLIANEAGASVYSASPLARAELPDLDVSLRGAVSIARRVQDPLAELVKIDPKSIGVGLYQHDVDQKQLAGTLDGVVESVVNQVGVDLNTASAALLAHIAGIGSKLAERIIAHRDRNGPFNNRRELLEVSGLGPKAFEQAAGFLRIRGGENALDATVIHPESYPVAQALLSRAGLDLAAPIPERKIAIENLLVEKPLPELAGDLATGLPTLEDIIEQLLRPGRDPREDLPAPILRRDVLSLEDLRPGLRLKGTVRNVVDFGAFVDIGVKTDGLIHRSQIPRAIRLKVGEVIEVEILKVEADRGRISLGWPGRTAGE